MTKTKIKRINLIVPVRNNSEDILPFFKSLLRSISRASIKSWNLLFAVNGSTDESLAIIKGLVKKYPSNIKYLNIKTGRKIKAQNCAIKHIKNNDPIFFFDVDILVDKEAIARMITSLRMNPTAIVFGGIPLPKISFKGNRFIFYTLNFPSLFFWVKTSKEFIYNKSKNLRNYFHGRFFVLRSKKYWLLRDEYFPDDIQLIDWIYEKYSANVFVLNPKARVYYKPYTSFVKRIKSSLRARLFISQFYSTYPNLGKFKKLFKLYWNIAEIRKLSLKFKFYFAIYLFYSIIESIICYFFILKTYIRRRKVNAYVLWDQFYKKTSTIT